MKFIIKREELQKALLLATRVSPTKHVNPSYTFLKLELNYEELVLTGTNGDISIMTTIPIVKEGVQVIRDVVPGATLVSAYLFSETVKKLEGEEVSFEVLDDTIATIETEKSNFKLNAVNADEFADLDFSKTGTFIELLAENFVTSINQVSFAVSTKPNNRPQLTAVNLESDSSKLIFTATDSARLAHKELFLEIPEKIKVNIPSRTLQEVIRMITNEPTIKMYIANSKILFILDNTIVSSSLIGGDYPNTKNILPKLANSFYKLEVNVNELANAIDRVSLFSSNDKDLVVKISMSEDSVEVSSRSQQTGSGVEQLRDFKYSGNRFEISFNCEFVKSAIKSFNSTDVLISFYGEMKPFVITNKEDSSVVQLITPVRTY